MPTEQIAKGPIATERVSAPQVRHVITCEYPPQPGGVSDYSAAIAAGLARSGEEVHVWCPGSVGDGPPAEGVTVHRNLGRISAADLRRVGRLMDEFPRPRQLLLQWVPHGYGYRSMNLIFCCWLWFRAAGRGDKLEIMVHEAYLPFSKRSWRQSAAASMHRLMSLVLLQKAARVFVAIPEWERRLRPYTLLRKIPFLWLPVLSNIPDDHDSASTARVRERYAPRGKFLIGHFGTFGSPITPLLEPVLDRVVGEGSATAPAVLLMGIRSEEFRARLIARSPRLANSVHATGPLQAAELSNHLAACDLLLQPYPDGVSTRRGSFLAGLSHGKAIVTTTGELTEPFWRECGVVALVPVGDPVAFANSVDRLRHDSAERLRLGNAARSLYHERFDISRSISILRSITE